VKRWEAQEQLARERWKWSDQLMMERDRRYTEVAAEREKALKIKELADDRALDLARQIQTYKDEKANELREQISSERGMYVTKDELRAAVDKIEATVKPVLDYVSRQQGSSNGVKIAWGVLIAVATLGLMLFLGLRK
jgi:hypothetical protein